MTQQYDGVDHANEILREPEIRAVERLKPTLIDEKWGQRACLTIRRLQEEKRRLEAQLNGDLVQANDDFFFGDSFETPQAKNWASQFLNKCLGLN